MKKFIDKFYYIIQCDSKELPKDLKSDMWFQLSEYDKLNETISKLEANNCKFTLLIENYDSESEEILNQMYICDENALYNI